MTYLAPDDRDVLQVWLVDLSAAPAAQTKKITNDPKRGVRHYTWAFDGKHVLYLQDSDGDENFHVYAADITSENVETRDLTPYEGRQGGWPGDRPQIPG